MSPFSDWISRQFSRDSSGRRHSKGASRKRNRLAIEQLESRRLFAVRVHQVNGTWVFDLDPNAKPPDADYYAIDLQFHQGTNSVHYIIDDLGGGNPTLAGRAQGDIVCIPGLEPAIEIILNDPGLLPGFTNQVALEDRNSGTFSGGLNTPGQDETFALNTWKIPGIGNIGPSAEYDPFPSGAPNGVPDSNPATPNILLLWDTFNTSMFAQPFSVVDSTTNGGDRIAVQATDGPNALTGDPGVTTLLSGGVFSYPGEFKPPIPVSRGDEFDISSDSVLNDGPTFSGNTNGILGPLDIEQGAGQNTIVISDQGDTTLAMPASVTVSSAIGPTGAVLGTIHGLAPVDITYGNPTAPDPFNTPVPISAIALTLVGADAQPTTFTVTGTLELGKVRSQPTWVNTLTLDGGAAGFNAFNVQAATDNIVTVNMGSGNDNVANFASDAPMNAGVLANISSALVVNSGTGTGDVANVSDAGDVAITPIATKVANVVGTGAAGLTNGITYTQITGFSQGSISVEQSPGGELGLNIIAASAQPVKLSVEGASTLSFFNVLLGNANGNTVNLVSTAAPDFSGNLDGIASAVTIGFGTGTGNVLNISDEGGTASTTPAIITMANAVISGVAYNQIAGFTPPMISYSEGAPVAVNIFTANAQPTDFTVAGTFGAGNKLAITGGTGGGNSFNLENVSADTVTINTGNGNANAVNVSNAGDLSGILSALIVHSGAEANSLAVSNAAGAASKAVMLTSSQIIGWTAIPIAYTEAAGGTLAISLTGPDAAGTVASPNTFNVASTLLAGNAVNLIGGAGGNNLFNIGSSLAANNGQLNKIGAAIAVDGGTGTGNILEVDDHGSTGKFNYNVSPSHVVTDSSTPRPFGGVTNYSNVQTLELDGTAQQNQFVVGPSLTTTIFINGYGPTTGAGTGDVLSIDFTGTFNAQKVSPGDTSYNGTVFDGKWTFNNDAVDPTTTRQDVNFKSIASSPVQVLAYGADAGITSQPLVKVFYANSSQQILPTANFIAGSPQLGFLAYEPTYHGGVRVAVGYFDNSGQLEIATAPGSVHLPLVKVFDIHGKLLHSFYAYSVSMTKGVNIAAGNVENLHTGAFEIDDIVTAPNSGVSEIKVFHNIQALSTTPTSPVAFRDFKVWSPKFIGGSTVAVADLNLDGFGDVIVGSGLGMAPTIDAFNVRTFATSYVPFKVFTPFTSGFQGGVNVSAVSVGSGVTSPLVVASQAGSGASTVQIFNGATGALLNTSTPFAGIGANASVRTVEKVIGGHLFVYAAQLTHGKSTAIRRFDPSNPSAGYVDYLFENDFQGGIFLG